MFCSTYPLGLCTDLRVCGGKQTPPETTMTATILPTRNEAWGFFGTMQRAGADPMQSWNAANAMIAAETDASPEGVRDFLDFRHGRHFADDVLSALADLEPHRLEEAIEAAVVRWQGWRIGRRTFSEEGIPAGLPYLTGWVTHFGILAEAAD
jgi:hypothetical protein